MTDEEILDLLYQESDDDGMDSASDEEFQRNVHVEPDNFTTNNVSEAPVEAELNADDELEQLLEEFHNNFPAEPVASTSVGTESVDPSWPSMSSTLVSPLATPLDNVSPIPAPGQVCTHLQTALPVVASNPPPPLHTASDSTSVFTANNNQTTPVSAQRRKRARATTVKGPLKKDASSVCVVGSSNSVLVANGNQTTPVPTQRKKRVRATTAKRPLKKHAKIMKMKWRNDPFYQIPPAVLEFTNNTDLPGDVQELETPLHFFQYFFYIRFSNTYCPRVNEV